ASPGRSGDGGRSARVVRGGGVFGGGKGQEVGRYAALRDAAHISETHRHSPPLRGGEAARHAMKAFFEVLPDLQFTIEGTLTAGHDVLVSWQATGTPRDDYSGAPLAAGPLQL